MKLAARQIFSVLLPKVATATVSFSFFKLRWLATLLVMEETSAPESSSALTGIDFPVGPVTTTSQVIMSLGLLKLLAEEMAVWLMVPTVVGTELLPWAGE